MGAVKELDDDELVDARIRVREPSCIRSAALPSGVNRG